MEITHRTHVCRLTNHSQVKEAIDNHAWSASTLWNVLRQRLRARETQSHDVANSHAQQVWDETGEIPDEAALKHELKDHPTYDGLHSQSSQNGLEELSEADSSWFGSADDRDNPPGYRKQSYSNADGNRVHEEHPRSTVTWKPSAIRHDSQNNRLRLSKGANHNSSPRAHEYILAEYDAPPAVTRETIQQVRAVWQSREERWELHVVCEHTIAAESPGDNVAGVDLGICNPAAVAFPNDAVVYPGNRLREDKHYFTREKYQSEGENGLTKGEVGAEKAVPTENTSCTL